ncbi:MAG: SPOR domain-containing protein [Spirochaetaceae bacterium]|jgi:DedD protein|nr:SPOR domain-containing protein [Spirochaetaceae bacterium]
MDKKKLLLVAASVGMFLVIVLGAAILVFTPRGHAEDTALNAPVSRTTSGRTGGDGAGTPQPVTPEVAGATAPVNVPVAPGYVPAPVPAAGTYPPEYNSTENTPNERNVITIPAPQNAGVPQAPAAPQRTSSGSPNAAPKTAKPAALIPAANPAVKQTSVKPAAAKPAQKGNYWVQTGSYAQKSYAENAKTFLSTKGIDSIVLNTSVSGKIYYRVRVGPYLSRNEADYWLSLIKSIDGMENSQVWKSGS